MRYLLSVLVLALTLGCANPVQPTQVVSSLAVTAQDAKATVKTQTFAAYGDRSVSTTKNIGYLVPATVKTLVDGVWYEGTASGPHATVTLPVPNAPTVRVTVYWTTETPSMGASWQLVVASRPPIDCS